MQLTKLRKKVYIALTLFLVCAVLLVSASYAWLILSRAPEITGITTNVGANGSLEIVLLSDSTHDDPDSIRSVVGSSMEVQEATVANLVWGNLIDLSDPAYGFEIISLRPAKLNVTAGADGVALVGDSILKTASFGIDGRVSGFTDNTVSAVCSDGDFVFRSSRQSYGVRAIGVQSGVSLTESSLAAARSAVQSNTYGARSSAEHAWQANGAEVIQILAKGNSGASGSYSGEDVLAVRNLLSDTLVSFNYIDAALRRGTVGMAAIAVSDDEAFSLIKNRVLNTNIPLSETVLAMPYDVPQEFSDMIAKAERDIAALSAAIASCDELSDGCSRGTLISLLKTVIDPDKAYLGDTKLSSAGAAQIGSDNVLTLAPDSGAMADIADFVGNYNSFATVAGISFELCTSSTVEKPHLDYLYGMISNGAASSIGEDDTSAEEESSIALLSDIYGFALDLAFRCNAEGSNLLLQTDMAQRVDKDSYDASTQGNGSFVRLRSENLSQDSVITLIDAVRVVFVDDMNRILAVAKPNVSNFYTDGDNVTAPLYLYEYSVNQNGDLIMGERRSEDTSITALVANKAKVISAVVLLDGDYVGNDAVDIMGNSVTGVLNLEFASDADLVPGISQN